MEKFFLPELFFSRYKKSICRKVFFPQAPHFPHSSLTRRPGRSHTCVCRRVRPRIHRICPVRLPSLESRSLLSSLPRSVVGSMVGSPEPHLNRGERAIYAHACSGSMDEFEGRRRGGMMTKGNGATQSATCQYKLAIAYDFFNPI